MKRSLNFNNKIFIKDTAIYSSKVRKIQETHTCRTEITSVRNRNMKRKLNKKVTISYVLVNCMYLLTGLYPTTVSSCTGRPTCI